MDEKLPNLHKQAKVFKNRKRLQHDGGRAWIKDGQLHEAIKDVTYRVKTADESVAKEILKENPVIGKNEAVPAGGKKM